MKLSFLTLLLTFDCFLCDLISSQDEQIQNDSIKQIDSDQKQSATVALDGEFENYYISVNETSAILLLKSYPEGSVVLSRLWTRDFPNDFQLGNAEFRLLYLSAKKSALVCTDSKESVPECLLIPVISSGPELSIGSLVPISNDYRHGQPLMNISNTFRVISEDGQSIITAYLNATETYEPSWIIRQEFDRSSNLITTGVAFDHRLAKLQRPFNASENVYAFQHSGFAYFLRYAYRTKFIGEGENFEWAWQLTRVCLNDRSRPLRSRASLPLNCSLSINSAEEDLEWRPTSAYFDEVGQKLYVYVQPDFAIFDRERLKNIRHRICSFDMNLVVREFERMFKRCYREYSHLVAAHSGAGTFGTLSCNDYRVENSGMPTCQSDVCNPDDCVSMYHLEIYTPIYGTPVSVIDFRHQSGSDIDAMVHSPMHLYVTKSKDGDSRFQTTQAFVRNARGTLFMVFLNSTKAELNAPHAPAWINSSTGSTASSLLELPGHQGVELVDSLRAAVSTFNAECSLYTDCRRLMDVASGEQARRLWGCGWCTNSDTGFSTTERECLEGGGVFYRSECPVRVDCYTPRRWNSDKSVTLVITGNFPVVFDYKIIACGSECRELKRLGTELEESLTCTLSPPYQLYDQGHSCGIEVSVANPMNQSEPFYVYPTCGPLLPATVNAVPANAGRDKIAWMIFAVISAAVVLLGVLYGVIRARRRRAKKRRRNNDSLSLPMAVSLEVSHNNEYVQRRVHHGNPVVRPTSGRPYEDLSFLVPMKLLIRQSSLEFEGIIGQGHFGRVYKAVYQRSDNEPATAVAVKTIVDERNARKFLQEGIIMETFDHPNVLSLIGISFSEDNLPMIITPFMGEGDLLTYIRNPQNSTSMEQLLKFGVEIACGMQYLQKLKFIHRDLASRNVMLDDALRAKIADFGLSRDVYESECYLSSQNTDLPIRWMPPESIERSVYTLKSDVWSYGVVLWELTTAGKVPYAGKSGFEILSALKLGQRLQKPSHCADEVYEIMQSCWLLVPEERPDFLILSERLSAAMVNLSSTFVTWPPYYNIAPVHVVTSA